MWPIHHEAKDRYLPSANVNQSKYGEMIGQGTMKQPGNWDVAFCALAVAWQVHFWPEPKLHLQESGFV